MKVSNRDPFKQDNKDGATDAQAIKLMEPEAQNGNFEGINQASDALHMVKANPMSQDPVERQRGKNIEFNKHVQQSMKQMEKAQKQHTPHNPPLSAFGDE